MVYYASLELPSQKSYRNSENYPLFIWRYIVACIQTLNSVRNTVGYNENVAAVASG